MRKPIQQSVSQEVLVFSPGNSLILRNTSFTALNIGSQLPDVTAPYNLRNYLPRGASHVRTSPPASFIFHAPRVTLGAWIDGNPATQCRCFHQYRLDAAGCQLSRLPCQIIIWVLANYQLPLSSHQSFVSSMLANCVTRPPQCGAT